jgi:RimJ/RimL family protein N-acetyltransferase
MSDLEITRVDPFDPVALDAWHAAYLAAELASEEEAASPFMLEEARAQLQDAGMRSWNSGWTGTVAGRVVVAGWLTLPLLDNLDSADLSVHVVADERRRGHGSAMARRLEQEALERGRTLLKGEAAWPYDAGSDGTGQAGREFARRLGYALALGDVKRILRLPVAGGLLDDLAAEAAPHHAAYTLRSWAGPVPDTLLDGWAALTATLETEAPTGDLEVEPEHIDAEVVREAEALIARQGRRKVNTVALDATGAVVAYTDIATTVHEPDRAYQWGTLVRPDARGHRLGLAVKVANLRLLQDSCPDLRRLTTYNAEVNARMVDVNDRLGFVPVARLGEFQKRLA